MYKPSFLLCALILCAGLISAQPKGYKPVSDEAGFRKKVAATAQTTKSIKSNFIQEKNIQVVSEKIISHGSFRFSKPDKVRMEYLRPYRYLLIINQGKVTIRDDQKTNSFSSKSNKLFTIINNIIIDCVQGTALDNKDFKATIFSNDINNLIRLTPVKKELRDFFTTVDVYLSGKDGSVVSIDLQEPSGDNTVITFTDKEINVPVPDSEFHTR